MGIQLGEKFKSYAIWDVNKEGKYDVFEVVLDDEGELCFLNHSDKALYALNFLGHSELVKIQIKEQENI